MSDAPSGRWADLLPRILSAVAMLIVGGIELWLGGRYFHIFVGVIIGLMMWELIMMLVPVRRSLAIACGVITAVIVAAGPEFTGFLGTPVLVILCGLAGAAIAAIPQEKVRMAAPYGALILIGGITLIAVRDNLGLPWILWLVLVVIASDVAGYFAGKSLGGPKFWPAISPKKTWSGTIAGWGGAALVGLAFGAGSGVMMQMMVVSVILAFAAQMGDIAESAIKRQTGVKDSSHLIPGHGGVLDRFDGLLGAAVAMLVIALVFGFPVGLV